MGTHLLYTDAPGPDEALPGYLLRLAHANHVPVNNLIRGIIQGTPGPLIRLWPAEKADFVDLFDISFEEVDALVIEPPDTQPGYGHPLKSKPHVLAQKWGVMTRFSRCCPACLHERPGIWQRAWRLGAVIVCPRHETFLASTCRSCGNPWFANSTDADKTIQRPYLLSETPPHPAQCHALRSNGEDGSRTWCGSQITDAPVSPAPRHLVELTQQLLHDWPWDVARWNWMADTAWRAIRGLPPKPAKPMSHARKKYLGLSTGTRGGTPPNWPVEITKEWATAVEAGLAAHMTD
jgi:hypothetical protein